MTDISEMRKALAEFRRLAPLVMTNLMATRTREDLLLAHEVHKADDLARKALARE